MRFDNFDDTYPKQAIVPTVIAANGTTTGSTIKISENGEHKGESLLFVVGGTTATAGTYTPNIQDSVDGTTWVDVDDKFLKGTEVGGAVTKDNLVSNIGYLGSKPYVRCNLVATSVVTGGTFYVLALFQHRHKTDFTTQKY